MNFHSREVDEILREFSADPEKGLTEKEAGKRLSEHGPNQLREQDRTGFLQILLSQLNNPVVYLLTGATVLAFSFGDILEGIAILVVILINTAIGFWMEYQASRSMRALKKMDRIEIDVIRNGKEKKIDAEKLVPGDLMVLEAGDLIPADARLIESNELSVDESPLTGESLPVSKSSENLPGDTPLADRENMVYKGTAASNGKGRAVVVATGMDTELGNISKMVGEAKEEKIPLNVKLKKLTRHLIWVTAGMAVLYFLFGWLAAGKDLYLLVQTSIAWTIAAIPEGLPIVASIALARGMLRLAKQNVVVKKLAAVEALGETTQIFTDKTGTLTRNVLTVDTLFIPGRKLGVEFSGDRVGSPDYDDFRQDENIRQIFRISVFCNNARPEKGEGDGDPLELALHRFAGKYDRKEYNRLRKQQRINEDPFDSEMKIMGTIHEMDNRLCISAKGAAEPILDRSARILVKGKKKKFGKKEKQRWIARNDKLSEKGLRVLAYGYRMAGSKEKKDLEKKEDFARELVFAGLVGFLDPPREDVGSAIRAFHDAGIRVGMVTGDHPGTAENIAEQVQLVEQGSADVITGKEIGIRTSGDDHVEELAEKEVFSRVDPGQKLDIIEQFQKKGEIVGMTGDGVNDAPALKKADIGIAMGRRGTRVAREVADLVLKDDSFPSMLNAVKQGRIVFGNIRKFIVYQLSYHLAEIVVIAAVSFTVLKLPLLPLQLLFLNLLSDVFPALAIGVGKGNRNIMSRSPKDPDEPIVTRKNWMGVFVYAMIISASVTGAYFFGQYVLGASDAVCNNIAFFSLALAQLWHVLNMREQDEHFLKNQITRNKYIWMALGICIAALAAAYFIPGASGVLSFRPLSPDIWILIGITSALPLVTIQMLKAIPSVKFGL